ncbi:SRPBCC family protein [Segniliparus rugosus]|uniref:SRPBCC family protein n=1 Tax=Segniliparus rugosus (strain ATCC BAA-974 / DSM 45345 / CCUG 50838 / CIP 108380 / JCM 13579 / CDC 945) TaxID=679197 RepID=E5XUA6_SEGRC|nr:SRPBCC family protein [Segniliparus rugosus]EFV12047.1 hypothetical protein HMPREF9336_03078 [Segniliparus rugosus ATCC BAA-974]
MSVQLRRVDDSFYRTAPIVFQASAELKAPVAQVWGLLEDLSWLPLLRFRWEGAPPHGPNSLRRLSVGKRFYAVEHCLHVVPNARLSFDMPEAAFPGLRAFAEDYRLEPTASGTKVTWTVAIEPTGAGGRRLGFLSPLGRSVMWALIKFGFGFGILRRRARRR